VERIQTPVAVAAEDELDRSLRPKRLEDFVGQDAVKDQLAVFIEAARNRGEALDHVLLAGPPGLGKTSLAQIVANELEAEFVSTAGPALERKGDVASYLSSLSPRSVFFVDEIHRLPRALEETFYPAMEDRRLPITVGQGAGARVVSLDLPEFTLIGATTRAGLLTTPLRDRFGVTHRLELYGAEELGLIVRRSAGILGVEIDADAAETIASRARGTPRVANRLLKRVRDFAEVRGGGQIDVSAATQALELLQVDALGLDRLDREILRTVCEKFGGGPVGLSTLAVAIGEEQDTVEDVYEPYLLQQGMIMRTPRGRGGHPGRVRASGPRGPARRRAAVLGVRPPASLGRLVDPGAENRLSCARLPSHGSGYRSHVGRSTGRWPAGATADRRRTTRR
jgi:Holliday junction DNA helicase RuvB